MVFKKLREDIVAFRERDPAAKGTLEVIFCYPGFHALVFHGLAGWFWKRHMYLIGRFISHVGRIFTGIEIHPGATIGRRLVIDHGSGCVIGETAVIGDDVTIYHGVTLGGVAPSVNAHTQIGVKRHPTLEDGVIVGSGAQILGPIKVGSHARIGANSVVTKDVPSSVTAVGIPANILMPRNKEKAKEFQAYGTPTNGCPDPVLNGIEELRRKVIDLSSRVEDLESEIDQTKPESPAKIRQNNSG